MALTKCKDCLLFDDHLVADYKVGTCLADNRLRSPDSRCPGALPRIDQDKENGNENFLVD
jgi:hypothetical protein